MKNRRIIFLDIKTLFYRLGIVFLLLTLSRFLFYVFNSKSFASIAPNDIFTSFWFDWITIFLYFSPFIVIHIIPSNAVVFRVKEAVLKVYFHLLNTSMLALNLIDIEYFKYTSKRSTFDLFSVLSAGNDFAQLIGSFISDFWVILLFLIVGVVLSEYLYRKTKRNFIPYHSVTPSILFNILVLIPLSIVMARGGLQLKPIGLLEVSKFSKPENSAFVLNTPFTMLKSYGKERLEMKTYFTEQQELAYFNPIQKSMPQQLLADQTNVVVIILESFGNEFVGFFNGGKTYTPFFDSILGQSLTFEYGIANGKKSIEAVPAILASLPTLMDNPYISSPYGNNKITSLASILRKNGYETAFYHGATNGSMRFDAFAAQAGFQHYFGRYEYNNDDHFDKTWGILDEYFNPWAAKKMSQLKEPFLGTLFTLSSHHPYFIPAHMRKQVDTGKDPIAASIHYADISLRRFFETAKKQPWFDNTLFVLVADHTPATTNPIYNERRFMYQIPIAFYHPKKKLPIQREPILFQQLDILPTVLDLLNIESTFYSYGKSYFKTTEREAFTYLEGSYYYLTKNHFYTFSNEKARNLYDFTDRNKSAQDSISKYKLESKTVENRLKAIIQRYNRDLIQNKTHVE
jgi:phosphoglycerol transferase MdoB-like AlkP superfamily enzyme